jgi:hypothetical protein
LLEGVLEVVISVLEAVEQVAIAQAQGLLEVVHLLSLL